MEREALIKKWLDHNLSLEEQNAFEQLEDYEDLVKMNSALKDFKAPDIKLDDSYETIKKNLKTAPKRKQWLKPLLKIAAVLAIGFGVNYYTTSIDTEVDTSIAEQTTIALPDTSIVELNANSILTFNESNWSDARTVNLQGEAFFKVAKGQKFDVVTTDGIVSVLGTQFNVKQRKSYYEVTCYEGLVSVTQNTKTVKLKPGDRFKLIDGNLRINQKESLSQPQWLIGESSFNNVPLQHVISELKNHYDYNFLTNNVDTTRLFTGSITHNNLDLALKSVTIPLNLSYSISEKSIELKRE